MGYKYIPSQYLPKLKEYSYKCIDASPVSKHIMQPYWTFCVKFLPMWMAPNLVTLIGFTVELTSYILISLLTCNFNTPAPSWVYFYAFFALQFYSLLDNLDGKQARRTSTSSPLGELFDHGCDCIACVLVCLTTLTAVHVQGDFAMGLFIMTTMAFWLATWEEYHTGVLFLGYFNGPTEGIQILSSIYLTSSFIGDEIWKDEIGKYITVLPGVIASTRLSTLVALSLIIPTLLTLYYNYKSVADHAKDNKKSALAPLRELFFFFFIAFLILTSYLQSPHLWDNHPHVFYLFFGLCFGELTHRLILAHVTKQRYALMQRPTWPMILSVANTSFKFFSLSPPVDELTFNIVLLVIQIVLFGHYFLGIVDEITTFLNIKCLSIPYKKSD